MKKHIKIYFDFFNYGEQDKIPCELCQCISVDCHHIFPKKMGGHKTYEHNGKTFDIEDISNIIALCRDCHLKAHDNKIDKGTLMLAHKYTMANK